MCRFVGRDTSEWAAIIGRVYQETHGGGRTFTPEKENTEFGVWCGGVGNYGACVRKKLLYAPYGSGCIDNVCEVHGKREAATKTQPTVRQFAVRLYDFWLLGIVARNPAKC